MNSFDRNQTFYKFALLENQNDEFMERTVFSPAQLEILDLMAYVESEDTLMEIRDMLSRYFAEKAEKEIDKLWDEGVINETFVEGWKTEHMRTPYKRM